MIDTTSQDRVILLSGSNIISESESILKIQILILLSKIGVERDS